MKNSSPQTLTPNLREAVIIHLCAIATVGLFALLEAVTHQSPEIVALRGVVFAAGAALFLWSLYLTSRSCNEGEALKPIVAFVVIILLELLIYSFSLLKEEPTKASGTFFEQVDYYGCAFYAVFFITLTFLAAPLAWHCARVEKPIHDNPDAYALINRALEIQALFMLLLTAVLLPPSLFLYCASSAELEQLKSWRQEYLEHCPDFVRDNTSDMLSLLNSSFSKSLHLRILENGWASTEHLESQLTGESLFESAALKGLLQKPADVALPVALGIAVNRYYSGSAYTHRAVDLVMRHSDSEQIHQFLNPETPLANKFREALISVIRAQGLEEYVRDLKRLAAEDINHEAALLALATLLPRSEFDDVWITYLCSSYEPMREQAVRLAHIFKSNPTRLMLDCLDRSNAVIAASLLKRCRDTTSYYNYDYCSNDEWNKRMDELACSADENVRSEANEWLRQSEALKRRSLRA
jgi:hypothetical protein